jgi:predicted PurR-regulated permease PerM
VTRAAKTATDSPLSTAASSLRAAASASERSGRLIAGAIPVIACIAAVWFLSWAKGILIPLSFAVFLTVCLAPAVIRLCRWGLPSALGAALVMIAVSGLIAVLVSRTRGDVEQLLEQVPIATRYLQHEIDRSINEPGSIAQRLKMLADLPGAASAPPPAAAGRPATRTVAPAPAPAPASVTTVAESTRELVSLTAELAAVLFLVYLLLAASDLLQLSGSSAPTDVQTPSPNFRVTFAQFAHVMHRYLGALVLTNTILGLVVWGVFDLLGVQRPGAWGMAVALAHFVPYVGSALAMSTLIGVALQTWLSGRSVRMNTVAVFVSLLVWGWLWGLPGLLLATPLTVGLKVLSAAIPDFHWIAALLDQRHPRTHRTLGATVLRAVQRVNHSR